MTTHAFCDHDIEGFRDGFLALEISHVQNGVYTVSRVVHSNSTQGITENHCTAWGQPSNNVVQHCCFQMQ